MTVSKGTLIRALDEDRLLTSEGDWPAGASKVIDFQATYNTPAGRDRHGNMLYGNRGFRYQDEGLKWERVGVSND